MSTSTDRPGSFRRLLWDIVRDRPVPAVFLTVFSTIGMARAGVYVAATGGLVQALIERNERLALIWAGAYLVASLIEQTYWPTRNLLVDDILDHAVQRIQRRVLEHAGEVPLIAFETEGFYARLQRANDNLGGQLSGMFMRLQECAGLAVFTISIMVPLWLVNPWIVPILVLGLAPSVIAEYRTGEIFHVVRTRHAGGDQFLDRIGAILTDRNVAAEIRLFGNGRNLVDRWRATRGDRATEMVGAERTKLKASLTGDLGVLVAIIASQALVIMLLINDQLPLGAWATVGMGTAWLSGLGYPIAEFARGLRENRLFVNDLFLFEDEYQQRWAGKALAVVPAAPAQSGGGMAIQVENITFRYPDAPENPVIEGISLRLEPGERVALVGVNGAGKSTLVRLLTGLYVPDSGTVEMDGHATTDRDSDPLQRQIGAVFQDYVAWQMTARDNIGIGNLDRRDDDDVLIRAAGAAGIGDLIAGLPDGLDTWLGREFGERDLSGGQWQRIAIARAFVRDARFLVLDEPTAALDPLAEQRIFERFADLAAGKTALMISHRLGPARFADRILVMDAGRIVESGTHLELMESKGAYARMFDAQAEWYNHE